MNNLIFIDSVEAKKYREDNVEWELRGANGELLGQGCDKLTALQDALHSLKDVARDTHVPYETLRKLLIKDVTATELNLSDYDYANCAYLMDIPRRSKS